MTEVNTNEPAIGSSGRTVITSLVGSVVLAAFYLAWQSPQDTAREKDIALTESLRTLRAEVGDLRKDVTKHQQQADREIAELIVRVDNGTADRFTRADFEAEARRYDERWENTKEHLARIEAQIGSIVQFMTEESRFERSLKDD